MPNRPSLRGYHRGLFSSAALAAAFLALPAFGNAPELSNAVAAHVVEGYLAHNPPVVRFALRQPVGAHPPAAYTDAVRAGLLRIVDGKTGQEPGPSYDLTQRGWRDITAGFFHFTQIQTGAVVANFVEVPVGHFRYVAGSASLRTAWQPNVTFKYHFSGNANVATLLRIGPAKDWLIANYTRPQPNLRLIGGVAQQTLPLRVCRGVWMVGELPFAGPCP